MYGQLGKKRLIPTLALKPKSNLFESFDKTREHPGEQQATKHQKVVENLTVEEIEKKMLERRRENQLQLESDYSDLAHYIVSELISKNPDNPDYDTHENVLKNMKNIIESKTKAKIGSEEEYEHKINILKRSVVDYNKLKNNPENNQIIANLIANIATLYDEIMNLLELEDVSKAKGGRKRKLRTKRNKRSKKRRRNTRKRSTRRR